MISVTITPTFTEDTLTFELPDGPISETVVKTLVDASTKEGTRISKIEVKVKTKGDFKL